RDTGVELARADVRSSLQVASIRIARGTVDIQGARVEGLGDPIDASARISRARVAVKARGEDVGLARVAKVGGREQDVRGHVAVDVDAAASRRGAEGRVDLRARGLALRGVEGGALAASASLHGRYVVGDLQASLGDAGSIHLAATDVALGGAAT